jgi:hypothetical protein
MYNHATMSRLFRIQPVWAVLAYVFLDTVCVGMGMGVPIFCILLGFPVGWYIMRAVTARSSQLQPILGRSLRYAALASLFTLLLMALIWGRTISMLFDPRADLANFGIPMILYEPEASFIGWQVLMIVIAPCLQLLAMVFGSYLTLLVWARGEQ